MKILQNNKYDKLSSNIMQTINILANIIVIQKIKLKYLCIKILQNNKYDKYMILLYDTIHYEDSIIHKYYMHDITI
jgi:HJR/Mrr/RecB family endonuclease